MVRSFSFSSWILWGISSILKQLYSCRVLYRVDAIVFGISFRKVQCDYVRVPAIFLMLFACKMNLGQQNYSTSEICLTFLMVRICGWIQFFYYIGIWKLKFMLNLFFVKKYTKSTVTLKLLLHRSFTLVGFVYKTSLKSCKQKFFVSFGFYFISTISMELIRLVFRL